MTASSSSDRRLIFPSAGLFAGPLGWALDQQISYMLVPLLCLRGGQAILYLTSLLALLLVAGGGWVSWHDWRRTRPGPDGHADRSMARAHFTATLGLLGAALFFLAILAHAFPRFVLSACDAS